MNDDKNSPADKSVGSTDGLVVAATDIVDRLKWCERYTYGLVPVTMDEAGKEIEKLRSRAAKDQRLSRNGEEDVY